MHRGVTHFGRLSERALERLNNFLKLFAPLDHLVDFYLFQMPPGFKPSSENVRRVERVARLLGERAAVEFRDVGWFSEQTARWAEEVGFTAVSVDSPDASWVVSSRGVVYLRMHGRTFWYSHFYDDEELGEVAERVAGLRPRRVYVFFNNDHAMLENARAMLAKLLELRRSI